MLEIFQDGGFLMLPIAFCSVIAMAICLERWWSLRRAQVLPEPLMARMHDTSGWPSSSTALNELGETSQLGYVVAVGLANAVCLAFWNSSLGCETLASPTATT